MTTLAEALGYALTREANLPRWSFTDHVEYLVEQAGSGRALGRALGVAESTVRGWRHGSTPRTGMRGFVIEMARDLMVQAHRGWPQDHRTFSITGEVKVSQDVRSRTLRVGAHIPPYRIDQALELWVAGDDQRAARMIESDIDRYYARVTMTDVTGVGW